MFNSSTIISSDQYLEIRTIDMHTGGEPLRVIIDGFPEIKGETVLQKRRYVEDNLDYLRQSLMWEPRGHADMYGCLITPPNDPDGDFGIIFMHNDGYSTMCGHATIAISKLAVELGWVDVNEGVTEIKIDAPCGRLHSFVTINNGIVEDIRFHCVPSFVLATDLEVSVENIGKVSYDLAYGGAFYAYVDLRKNALDISITSKDFSKIVTAGRAIKQAIIASDIPIAHPFESDLSFLYGVIFIDDPKIKDHHSRNVCVFADGEVDRCPTGSGVSGRMALHFSKGEVEIGEEIKVESLIDSVFTGSVVRQVSYGEFDAVIPEVGGTAYVTGEHRFLLDKNDPLKNGFVLR